MKERRVVVTGFGAISPLGNDWNSVAAKLKSCTNAVQVIEQWGGHFRVANEGGVSGGSL